MAIRRATAQFKNKDGNKAERRQFPLLLAKACTIHKSQAATYHAGVHARLDNHCKQAGQAYVALSRSPTQKLCTLECFDNSSLHFNANARWALVTLKEKLARSSGPNKQALQDLWQAVIRPTESAAHYQMQLAHMERPNWKQYAEEQRAKEAPKEEDEGGALTCPRCGWVAKDAAAYKKHKCPAKQRGPKAKAKTPCFFFQRQKAAHCGMHALNNALGRALFTPGAMQTAARTYLQEMQGVDGARDEHIRVGGWYSVQVLYTAVFAKGFTLDFHAPLQTWEEALQAAALIQNWSNHHWVAYRWGSDGEIYRLDSMQLGPSRVSKAEFVASMATHWTYAIKQQS